ncbi:MAG TPA: hypothetical protein PJ982_17080 [Lacipirellulaceae bacterium]|nr:hypothetical protein [Lacipirellulaceae bacterium]
MISVLALDGLEIDMQHLVWVAAISVLVFRGALASEPVAVTPVFELAAFFGSEDFLGSEPPGVVAIGSEYLGSGRQFMCFYRSGKIRFLSFNPKHPNAGFLLRETYDLDRDITVVIADESGFQLASLVVGVLQSEVPGRPGRGGEKTVTFGFASFPGKLYRDGGLDPLSKFLFDLALRFEEGAEAGSITAVVREFVESNFKARVDPKGSGR